MQRFLWICLAGAVGSGARYLLTLATLHSLGDRFPYGTLLVNLAGCFAITAVMHIAIAQAWSPTMRAAVTVGFLGGFTTYSSFNYETMRLIEQGAMARAAVNVAATLAGGWAAGLLGLFAARALLPR
jgi:CrcB protein